MITNEYQHLQVMYPQQDQDIVRITLDRPEVHNAFNELLITELTDIAQKLSHEEHIRVVLFSGNGRSFCAGADLHWMQQSRIFSKEQNYKDAKRLSQMFNALNSLPQAVIGKINGSAIGGGTGLVAICDVSVGLDNAKFGFSEVNLGITPAVISPYVVEKIGLLHAREYFITGELFSGKRAQEIGLLNYAVSDKLALDQKIDDLIRHILISGKRAVHHIKLLLSQISSGSNNNLQDYMSRTIADSRTSSEGQEGISAFLEKRKPNW